MDKEKLLDNLLYLEGALTFIVDIKNKTIESAYDKNKELASEYTYESFAKKYKKIFGLNTASEEKLIRFLNNLIPSNTPFTIPVDVISEESEPVRLTYKGYKCDTNKVLFSVTKDGENHTDEIDQLTRTYTKNFIIKKVAEAIQENRQFVLMMLDIDNFKLFNDTYGHMFGDIVLVETAASLRKNIRNEGYIARVGGDEFMVMVYIENEYNKIHEACSNLRQAISNLSSHNIKKASITATIGCAAFPQDGTDYETLFKKADKALYRGKKKGRNCFIMYTEEKCGDIDDDIVSGQKAMDRMFDSANNYSIITGVFEILNRDSNVEKNIYDSLSLIGNYFVLDRITLFSTNPDTFALNKTYTWFQADVPEVYIDFLPENRDKWKPLFDKTGTLKIVQVDSNKNLPIYDLLKNENTSALLCVELQYKNRIFGSIRFDMCSINKFWQQNDIASLQLIAKILAIIFNREYELIQIEKELYYDKLTNVYNYTKWRDTATNDINDNPDVKYSIMELSVKGLKTINDMYGTKTGDEVLICIANAFKEINFLPNIFGRINGDRFIACLKATGSAVLRGSFVSIENYLKEHLAIGDKIKLTCGIYQNIDGDALSDAIDKANIAAKNANAINRIIFFSQDQFEIQRQRTEMELHQDEALTNGEFLLYLQPKVDTDTKKVVGAEALTRWNFNGEKILTPNYFIPLFESNGFITKLDYQVFENVCMFQKALLDEKKELIPISVNVSRYQKNFDNYINRIECIRKKYDIDPKYIEIEITEGMYLDNAGTIKDFMNKLHLIGYTISMDDFGSGYSNLSSLAKLNFDIIKLDKNFCANMDNEKESLILNFVMKLANKLNMKVLCEGVETQEYAEFLREIGCHLVQGFLYDRPIPHAEFKAKYIK